MPATSRYSYIQPENLTQAAVVRAMTMPPAAFLACWRESCIDVRIRLRFSECEV